MDMRDVNQRLKTLVSMGEGLRLEYKSRIMNAIATIMIVSALLTSGLVTAYQPPEKVMADGDGTATVFPAEAVAGTLLPMLNISFTAGFDGLSNIGGGINITLPENWDYPGISDTIAVTNTTGNATLVTETTKVGDVWYISVSVDADTIREGECINVTLNNVTVQITSGDPTIGVLSSFDDTRLLIAAPPVFTVNPGPENKLVITGVPPASVAGTESGTFTVTVRDLNDNDVSWHGGINVTLASNSGTGFFTVIQGGVAVTNVTVPYGASSATFYYNDNKTGIHTISVANDTLIGDDVLFTVNPAGPHHLTRIGDAEITVNAGLEAGPIQVAVWDEFNNPVADGVRVNISWTTHPDSWDGETFNVTADGTAQAVVPTNVVPQVYFVTFHNNWSAPWENVTFTVTAEGPSVVQTSVDGGTLAYNTGTIMIVFDREMNTTTVNGTTVLITNKVTGDKLDITEFVWSLDNKTVNVNWTGDLPGGIMFNLTIIAEPGNAAMAAEAIGSGVFMGLIRDFQTQTPPTITVTNPTNGAVDVTLTQNVVVTFSEAMNTASVTYSCTPNPGGWSVSWNSPANTITTFTHNAFTESTLYTFQITGGTDVAGNALAAGAVPNPWRFTTDDTLVEDVTPPTVTGVTPEDGAIDIEKIGSEVTVTFSEPVQRDTAEAAFVLNDADGNAVAGTFEWDDTGMAMTFTPTEKLKNQHVYTVNVGTGTSDFAGLAMAEAFSSIFTTEWNLSAANPAPVTLANGVKVTVTAMIDGDGSISVAETTAPDVDDPHSLGIYLDINLVTTDPNCTLVYALIEMDLSNFEIPEGFDLANLKMYFWDGSAWVEAKNTAVDVAAMKLTANVTHFTVFAARSAQTDVTSGFGLSVMIAGILIAVLVVVALLAMMFMRKKPEEPAKGETPYEKPVEGGEPMEAIPEDAPKEEPSDVAPEEPVFEELPPESDKLE